MKKNLSLLSFSFLSFFCFAQLPVSHLVEKRKALIEDFTGNTCGGCPDGNEEADRVVALNPNKVFSMCVHDIYFGIPYNTSSSLEFRVPDGLAIENIHPGGVSSFPTAYVNRKLFNNTIYPSLNQGICLTPVLWENAVNNILAQNAYVNIAGEAFLNPNTRELIVNIEAYYTANSPTSTNKISVALIQDSIIAYQKNASWYPAMYTGTGEDYIHNHALRDIITSPPQGELMIGSNNAGTLYNKTINYIVANTYPASGTKTIPADLSKLSLLAWIAEADTSIINACKIPITITTSTDLFKTIAQNLFVSSMNVYPNPMTTNGVAEFYLNKSSDVTMTLVNSLGQVVKTDELKTLDIGNHKYEIDANTLANGLYFLNVKVGESIITQKISIVK